MTKCFLVTATTRAALSLRRYISSAELKCPREGYHNALMFIQNVDIKFDPRGYWDADRLDIPREDPRWPTHCACGFAFREGDEWQEYKDRLYTDGSKDYPHRDLPVGAMYYADWLPKNMFWDNKTDDHLHVVTPGGTWDIDGRASNCTLPNDRLHRCWVRHGEPPNIHVDKAGLTCSAGAGSIQSGSYHGFLHDGSLT
jgi:hypothetical protein